MSRDEPGKRMDQDDEDNAPEHLEMFDEKNGFQSTDTLANSKAQLDGGKDEREEAEESKNTYPNLRNYCIIHFVCFTCVVFDLLSLKLVVEWWKLVIE